MEKDGNTTTWQVRVPANSKAIIYIPSPDYQTLLVKEGNSQYKEIKIDGLSRAYTIIRNWSHPTHSNNFKI